MEGRVGRFFACFGYVVGFSILMSLFVSFTLTPMLCSRFLKAEEGAGHTSKSGVVWRVVEGTYTWLLGWSLRHRWVSVGATVLVLRSTPVLVAVIEKDFVPRDDQSELEVAMTLPEGYSLDQADAVCREIEGRLRNLRGVTHTFTTIGDTSGRVARGQGDVTRGTIYCRLVDLAERKKNQFDVIRGARGVLDD